MIERINGYYLGFPAEIVYSPGVREVVFWVNPDGLSIGVNGEPFFVGHRTFSGVTRVQWERLKCQLTQRAVGRLVLPAAFPANDAGNG